MADNINDLAKAIIASNNNIVKGLKSVVDKQQQHLDFIKREAGEDDRDRAADEEARREAARKSKGEKPGAKAKAGPAGPPAAGGLKLPKLPKLGGVMGKMFSGLAGLVGALGKGAGLLLKGLAVGLIAFANPLVLGGAAILGGSIIAIGAGIAGAAWITGAALPTFAKGMQSFEALDGKKLIDAGKGIAAVGGGLAVFGVGGAAAGMGSIISNVSEGLVSFFGGKTPFDKVLEFQKYKFNLVQIENNAASMKAFAGAMALQGGAGILAGIGGAVGAIGGAITSFFGGDSPMGPAKYAKVLEFEKAGPFNVKKIEANAAALVAYSIAMAKSTSIGTIGKIAGAVGAVADSITGFFGGETGVPYEELTDFQMYSFDQKAIEENAKALVAYSTAMSNYKGTAAVGALKGMGGAIAGAITGLFGGDRNAQPPFQSVIAFGAYQFNNERITANATALSSYAKAMSDYAGTKSVTDMKNIGSSIGGAVTGLLGGKTAEEKIPFAAITKFQTFEFNQAQIEINALALVAYSKAMSKYAGIKAGTDLKAAGSAISQGVIGLLGGKTTEDSLPYAQMKKFAAAEINKEGIEKNALGLVAFGKAMAAYAKTKPPTTFGQMLGGLYDGALSFFGAGKKKELPLDQIKKFGNADLPVEKIKKSAEALAAFGSIKVNVKETNFEALAKNLGESIPLLMHLAKGDVYDPVGPLNSIDFGKGILNPELRLQEVADKVALVREILTGVQAPRRQASDQVNATGAGGGGGGGGTIVNSPTNVNNSQSNVAHSSRAMIGGPVAANRRSWNSRKQR